MPVFTKEELLQCRDEQRGITAQEIELRFSESVFATGLSLTHCFRCGGSARNCFTGS